MTYSEAQAKRVRKELAGRPGLIEKQMFGGIAFLLGGNMAVGVHGEDLIVRVDPAQTDVLLHEPGAKPFNLSGSREPPRSEEHTSELQSHVNLVCRLLLEKKKKQKHIQQHLKKNKKQKTIYN